MARAESTAELLGCVRELRPDVIITDVTMPDGTVHAVHLYCMVANL